MKTVLVGINSKYVHTNLAIRYIKSYCSEFDVGIKEYSINDSIDNILSDLYFTNADVIGFSCYIWNIEMVLKLCTSIKKIKKGLIILLGGPEVSFDSSDIIKGNNSIDYIIKGEGEVSAKNFLSFINYGNPSVDKIDGLVYRRQGQIVENIQSNLIENLDSIPFPYGDEEAFDNKLVYYESSRGCPYNCSYCLSSTIKGVRFFSIERVKKDLLWFINRNINLIKFVDRTFNCNKNYYGIFKFLSDNMSKTRFHFEISADSLDDSVIDYLNSVQDNLFQFEIGIQSTNIETLKNVNRALPLIKLSDKIRKLREPGNIHIHLDLIAGLPGEDYFSFSKSFDEVFNLKPHMLQLGFLKMLKGSKVRDEAGKYGIEYADYPPYEVMKTDDLSFNEIVELKNISDIVDKYYNSGRFQAILTYLLMYYDRPFVLFKDIASFEGLWAQANASIGNIGQYRLLYDFCFHKEINVSLSIIKECLAFDYLNQGRNPSVPDFLSSDDKMDKNYIYSLLSKENYIEKILPHYSNKPVKEIVKNVYLRKFSFDVLSLIYDNKMALNPKIVVFDYGFKNSFGRINCFQI